MYGWRTWEKYQYKKQGNTVLGCKYLYCKIRWTSQNRKFLYNRLKLQLRYLYWSGVGFHKPKRSGFFKNESASVAGYYTIPLDSDIWLTVSQNFSVVLNLTNLGYGYPIVIEEPLSGDDGDNSKATANSGKGFISRSEGTWEDITIDFPNTNVCIKAFIDSYISEFLGYTNPPADSDHVVSMRISMETEKWILIM